MPQITTPTNSPEHPTEDMLERYVLHQSDESELEMGETHSLACHEGVDRLEILDLFVNGLRDAYDRSDVSRPDSQGLSWLERIFNWFTPAHLGWVGAAAVLALAIAVTPRLVMQPEAPVPASLTVWRGAEHSVLPARHPLALSLNCADLPDGAVTAELVDAIGRKIWQGDTVIRLESAGVTLPSLESGQMYFLRVSSRSASGSGELLREFAFGAK